MDQIPKWRVELLGELWYGCWGFDFFFSVIIQFAIFGKFGSKQWKCMAIFRDYPVNQYVCWVGNLGGGLKYFLCSSLFGEMIQFDKHIFQKGWNHQPVFHKNQTF